MKRACKSHLRRQRRKRKGTKSAFRACNDGQACTFPTALSDKSEVSEVDGWGIYHHLNNSDFSDDKQCGYYYRLQEKKIPKEKSTEKLSCWNPYLGKYGRYTEKWQEADLPKSFSTGSSLPLFGGHAKGWNVLCLIAKFTKTEAITYFCRIQEGFQQDN